MRIRSSAWMLAGVGAGYFAARAAIAKAREYDLHDRVVVVTGGSRGLGFVLARQLADEGARVAICARTEADLNRAARDLRTRTPHMVSQVCDVTQSAQVTDFLNVVRRELGPVDVLINNAGIIQVGPIETMTGEDFHEAMAVHCWAPLRAIAAVLPDMRRRGEGRIVNIASIGGEIAVPHLLPYCASKFALVGLSRGLRAELMKEGVLVTTVCPGMMRTGSPRRAWFKGQHRAEYAWFSISDSIPLLSINAERAARQILAACRSGRAHVRLSVPAKIGVRINALAPELVADMAAIASRLLPKAGGSGAEAHPGSESTSAWSPSLLTLLTERAAIRNNEFAVDELSS